MHLFSHSFYGSETQVWLGWVLCLIGVSEAAVTLSHRLCFHLKGWLGRNLLLGSFRLLAELAASWLYDQGPSFQLAIGCKLLFGPRGHLQSLVMRPSPGPSLNIEVCLYQARRRHFPQRGPQSL